jgi:hypothetical protein
VLSIRVVILCVIVLVLSIRIVILCVVVLVLSIRVVILIGGGGICSAFLKHNEITRNSFYQKALGF